MRPVIVHLHFMSSEEILPLYKIIFSIELLILGSQGAFHLFLTCIFMSALLIYGRQKV